MTFESSRHSALPCRRHAVEDRRSHQTRERRATPWRALPITSWLLNPACTTAHQRGVAGGCRVIPAADLLEEGASSLKTEAGRPTGSPRRLGRLTDRFRLEYAKKKAVRPRAYKVAETAKSYGRPTELLGNAGGLAVWVESFGAVRVARALISAIQEGCALVRRQGLRSTIDAPGRAPISFPHPG
jgi:hypothetical protein